MSDFFVRIYDFFRPRRGLLWTLLGVMTAAMTFFALRVGFAEQTTSLFQDDEDGHARSTMVFNNLRVLDKVMVMFTASDPDEAVECAEQFEKGLMAGEGAAQIASITSGVGSGEVSQTIEFIYDNLPLWLTEGDYARIDSLLAAPEGVEQAVAGARGRLASPMGMAVRDVTLRDPLGLAVQKFAGLGRLSSMSDYTLHEGRIFSPDGATMLVVIEPWEGIGNTGAGEVLISAIERQAARCTEDFPEVAIDYFGGPAVAVHNARLVKSDTALTLAIALAIIVAFIVLTFRNRLAIVLIVVPVVFGTLFALAAMWLGGHHIISAIAVGAGSAVLGIALSYSIHVISHGNHTPSPCETVRELAWPLTVGSFTTIGAFLGLLFTRSQLLRDFGLFSALTLVGTTLFCLVFLPHLLSEKERATGPSPLGRMVDRIGSYAYDRRRWLMWTIVGLCAVCLFFYGRVGFDSDMSHLSYMPPQLERAQERLAAFTPEERRSVVFVSTGDDASSAHMALARTERTLEDLVAEGLVTGYVSAAEYLPSPSVIRDRTARWEEFWAGGRREQTLERVARSAAANGFRAGAFDGFARDLTRKYPAAAQDSLPPFLTDWVATAPDGTLMMVTHVRIAPEHKEEVYKRFAATPEVVVLDRAWMTNHMARTVSDDFNLTLFIAGLLIFAALLISYGRIELTLVAFMPMLVSWIIILGVMAIVGIEFNIVSIILATFIFGIGDDFSIFIMDGLLAEYRDGRRMLAAHKTAIFFSAFTIVVGLGALVFAHHPAMHSMAVVSVLGIVTVIAVAYVLQPVVFRAFVTSQTDRGGFPYTLAGLANSLYAFLYFVVGCSLLQGVIATLWLVPVGRQRKKLWFHTSVSWAVRFFLRTMITTRRISLNDGGENLQKPAVVIANHSSFIDILVMLGLHPKMVMVTNSWVWRSPFFGRIVRYCDCYNASEGYDSLVDTLREKVAEGYSVVVFPEGTRSEEGHLGRFHKGAFHLAERLGLDIVPVVLYGNGLVSSRSQPFYIKKGLLVSKILPRITPDDVRFGSGYSERAKRIGAWFGREYGKVYEEYNRTLNPWFHDALIKSYIYKGPVLEWYMRVKVRMEGSYDQFDRLVPRTARVVDIGCGYGALSWMLAMLSRGRRVTGIDYDADKIAVARHSFLSRGPVGQRMSFAVADAADAALPGADVYILSDVLHYLDFERQEALLGRCFDNLSMEGLVIVRDGDAAEAKRHRATRRTEQWSTRLVRFNKTSGELHFTDSTRLTEIALRAGFAVEVIDDGGGTSNKIYIMRHA